MIFILLVGIPVSFLVVYYIWRAFIGHRIGVHLSMFGQLYDQYRNELKPKQVALRESLKVFQKCPGLNQLTNKDLNQFSEIISAAPDPKHIVNKIILGMVSRKIVKAFRDPLLLQSIVDIYRKKTSP